MRKKQLLDDAKAADPVRHCKVYKLVGCCHVDGPLCDMRTCTIEVKVIVSPLGQKEVQRENDHKR